MSVPGHLPFALWFSEHESIRCLEIVRSVQDSGFPLQARVPTKKLLRLMPTAVHEEIQTLEVPVSYRNFYFCLFSSLDCIFSEFHCRIHSIFDPGNDSGRLKSHLTNEASLQKLSGQRKLF